MTGIKELDERFPFVASTAVAFDHEETMAIWFPKTRYCKSVPELIDASRYPVPAKRKWYFETQSDLEAFLLLFVP